MFSRIKFLGKGVIQYHIHKEIRIAKYSHFKFSVKNAIFHVFNGIHFFLNQDIYEQNKITESHVCLPFPKNSLSASLTGLPVPLTKLCLNRN